MAAPSSAPTGRFAQFVSSLPLMTLTLLAINLAVFIGMSLGDFMLDTYYYSLNAHAVVYDGQVYRVITAQFMHGGLLHIGFNMMTLYQFGSGLEPMFGSLQYAFITTVFVVATGITYVALAMLTSVLYKVEYAYQLTVGFSGVLFAMAVDEASLSPYPTRSVFGFFTVPTWLYPWVLMLVLQLFVPGISFLGHLSGCIVGMLHAKGFFRAFIPTVAFLRKIEDAAWFHRIRTLPSYKLLPLTPILREDMPIVAHLTYACGALFACLRARGGASTSAPPASTPRQQQQQPVDVEAATVVPIAAAPSAQTGPYTAVPTAPPVAEVDDEQASLLQPSNSSSDDANRPARSREEVAALVAAAAAARAAATAARGRQAAEREPESPVAPSPKRVLRNGVLQDV